MTAWIVSLILVGITIALCLKFIGNNTIPTQYKLVVQGVAYRE